MGCGSSKKSGAESETAVANVALALSSHISAILGIPPMHPDVQQFVSSCTSEGCYTPDDFDELTIDELTQAPFNLKRLHLKKVRVDVKNIYEKVDSDHM